MGLNLQARSVEMRPWKGEAEWVVWFRKISGSFNITPFLSDDDIADAIEKMRPLHPDVDYHIRYRGGIAFTREEDAIMILLKFA